MKEPITPKSPASAPTASTSSQHRRLSLRRHPSLQQLNGDLAAASSLLPGDNAAAFQSLRSATGELAGESSRYNAYIADMLADQTWDMARLGYFRSSAILLQIDRDQPEVEKQYEEIDDAGRHYHSWRNLIDKPDYRNLLAESDRAHRRRRQTHSDLLKARKER